MARILGDSMTSNADDDASLAPSPTPADSAPRLLVIDDDLVFRGIIGKVGEKAGFAITQAASYDEAEKLLRKVRFDCITLDLSLGRNYGLEVIRLLDDIGCKTPVIVISGVGQTVAKLATSVGRMLRLNICEPVPKPVDFARLREILARIKGDFARHGTVALTA